MKGLTAFIRKELRHIMRDRLTLLIMFVMPVLLVTIFGFAITTEIKNAQIAILDESNDATSHAIADRLTSSDYFVKKLNLHSNSQLDGIFADGQIKLAVIFPPNFQYELNHTGRATVQLLADASDLNSATTLVNYARQIIQNYQIQINASTGHSMPFDITVRMIYNPEMKSVFMFVPGILALVLAIISAMMTAISIAREKENGTMRVLRVSPLSASTIILGKVIPYLIISFIGTLMILAMSVYVFGMEINGSIALLMGVCILFLFTSMAMGILIASFVDTQQLAAVISIVGLFLPTALLSGFIYPIENMPLMLQALCQIFPAKWFIIAIKSVMLKGLGLAHIWLELSILITMSAAFIGISLRRFNSTKQQ